MDALAHVSVDVAVIVAVIVIVIVIDQRSLRQQSFVSIDTMRSSSSQPR